MLSSKTENPLIKSIFLAISQDSTKHSGLLRGISKSMAETKVKTKDCEKTIGKPWIIVSNHLEELKKGQANLSSEELYEKLREYESSLGEEYHVFVQMQTLEFMTETINRRYKISLEKVKGVFESIIKDEEHHRELLATIKEMLEPKTQEIFTPIVKYQTPDQWINYIPHKP